MSKRKRVLILAALAAAVVCAVFGRQFYAGKTGGRFTIYGNVDIRTVNLGFRVGGKLAELLADEGDRVEPGQTLGRLDKQPYENALAGARGGVLANEAGLRRLEAGFRSEEIEQARAVAEERRIALAYAEKMYRRQVDLLPSRAVSADDVDSSRTARDQARAALEAAQAGLELYERGNRVEDIEAARAALMRSRAALAQAELELSDTELVAPSAGMVLTRAVEPGSMLAPGSPVFSISLTSPVWVRAYVDGRNLARAVPGTVLDVYADHRAGPYKGRIGFVSPTAEFTPKSVQTPELRTDLVYRLRIVIENPDEALRQGMPVTVIFPD